MRKVWRGRPQGSGGRPSTKSGRGRSSYKDLHVAGGFILDRFPCSGPAPSLPGIAATNPSSIPHPGRPTAPWYPRLPTLPGVVISGSLRAPRLPYPVSSPCRPDPTSTPARTPGRPPPGTATIKAITSGPKQSLVEYLPLSKLRVWRSSLPKPAVDKTFRTRPIVFRFALNSLISLYFLPEHQGGHGHRRSLFGSVTAAQAPWGLH